MSNQPENTEQQAPEREWKITRRQFLIGLGLGIGALAVGAYIERKAIITEVRLLANDAFINGEAPSSPPPKNPLIWFEIAPDNTAKMYMPKIEMGQGILTSLAQIAADELDLDWDTIVVDQPKSDQGFDPNTIFTFGSTSITSLYEPIRNVSATMRQMLRDEAARQLNVDASELTTELSYVYVTADPDNRLSYGDIVANRQGEWEIPNNPPTLKSVADFTYIGQSMPRVDLYAKVTGRAQYGFDARVPDMLYGAVARPPRYGATLASASAGTAGDQPGVVEVVIRDDFAGIVAETRPQAYAALEFLELEWDGGIDWNEQELDDFMRIESNDDAVLIQREGNTGRVFSDSSVIQSEYKTPMAAHAQLEPQGGLAEVTADLATIYTSTQAPDLTMSVAASKLGLDKEQIVVEPMFIGGGFGRKTGTDAAIEAAIFSQAVGRPVHVGWNRTEEMQYGYRRPPSHHILTGSVDDEGNIIAFEHQVASGDVLFWSLDDEGGAIDILPTILGADPLAAIGSLIIYNVPNRRVLFYRRKMQIPTGYWRGLGTLPNTFAVESFMDELAASANVDPLQFRLNHLPEDELGERMRVALERVAEASDWDNLSSDTVGKGIAMTWDRKTVVVLVMTVSLEDNRIKPLQAWCAVDPGFVVNPNGAAAQVQGQIVMGLSSTLYERITIEDGIVKQQNFDSYRILTIQDTPQIDVLTINSGDTPTGGLGEPVMGVVPAAMGNALFDLTGTRHRSLPFELPQS